MPRSVPVPLPGDDADEHSCTIWYIRRRLRRLDYGAGRMVTYLTALIATHKFPRPFPRLKGTEVVEDVAVGSSWHRAAVDQWLLDFLPPDAGAALDAAARRQAADMMDHRAAQLQLGRRVGGIGVIIDGGRP